MPFLGKIGFLCKSSNVKKIMCHPESSSSVEKVFVDYGVLTFQKDPDKVNLMYRKKTCRTIIEAHKQNRLTGDFLKNISNSPFGRALLYIDLAKRNGQYFTLKGDGLLLTEMDKIRTDDDFEKVARLILRKEQMKQAQISSIITALEFLERQKSPSEHPVGSAPRYWQSERTKKKYERLGHYETIERICSVDPRVATNILNRGGTQAGFADFGAFFDTYYKTGVKGGQDWVETFSFLSWCTDSSTFLSASPGELDNLNWSKSKVSRTTRHQKYLLRFTDEGSLRISSPQDRAALGNSGNTEIIDMNIDPEKFREMSGCSHIEYCPSNVFVASNVPVSRENFESVVLEILQSLSPMKDSQGAFYYPDFRFLVASTLGLSLKSVDRILAYIIQTGSDVGRRLWFFPAFGKVPSRDRPDQQLMDVVLKPFDSITLNY
ncbi:MAG TPA: hypothetical protein VK487_00810 [Candidatus Bathyarchaeia archaeon]|nr:hypothetical protein [Candidatus Bathyarchaeia archaeon]